MRRGGHRDAPVRVAQADRRGVGPDAAPGGVRPGVNQGSLSAPDGPSAPAEQQAIERLLALYREAVLQEDIDRVQALLAPPLAQTQTAGRRTAMGPRAQ